MCEVDENLLLGEIKQITTNIFPQCRPALNENNLFWVDGRIAISDIFQEIYTATLTDETTLPNHPPVAVVGQDQTVDTGERVRFDASGSHDEDGEIVSYTWDFGDDSFATGVTASHTYDSAGEYTVTLTVEDNDGATAIATCIITVEFALFEKVIPAYRANIKSKWFTSGTTLWTYWSDTWVEYNVDIPFSGYYYIGIYAKNTGNLPAPEGYKFRIEVDVDGRDTGKIIEVPYVANSTRYIPRSKKIYLNRGRRKIKYKWLNDYHDPGRYDANIQIQKIYVNASPKKVRIPVNYTSYKSSGWKFISSSRTLYVSSRYSKAVEYVMPVPVTGYHYVGFRAKATKDCRVYVYVDGLRQEGTISLPANDDYRYRSKRLKLNKGSRKIKFRFTKYAPKTIYLNEVYIKQCSKQSQVATAAAVKSRWYTRYPTLYTYWSVSWAEYNFDIPRDGYYYVGISVRNKDGRLLPYGYMFDIEVHDVHIRERMNDGIYDYTWSRKGKISIRANGDNYLSGFIRTYLPKGEHKIKYMWLNDYHIPGRYDANIQIKEVFVKEVQ